MVQGYNADRGGVIRRSFTTFLHFHKRISSKYFWYPLIRDDTVLKAKKRAYSKDRKALEETLAFFLICSIIMGNDRQAGCELKNAGGTEERRLSKWN